ncbi:hypothetical protein BVC80_8883g24 [Macleaya cordata]|uniref:Uncharacterized protein n=1 Tax=Macleaya cordata TaxID=56857 RepID=A0A200Q7D4_MACCD|nr:hypothetical protein BVC80_8883g24 [Macleaya cordata]
MTFLVTLIITVNKTYLQHRNPLFRLPTDEPERKSSHAGTRVAVRLVFSMRSTTVVDSSSSPTQMTQAETSSTGHVNSGETFSSELVEGGIELVVVLEELELVVAVESWMKMVIL